MKGDDFMLNKFEKFALGLTSLEIIGGIVVGALCYGSYNYHKGRTEARKEMQHLIEKLKGPSTTED